MWPNPQEIAEKLYKKKQMFLVSLAIVKLKMNFWNLELFIPIFLYLYNNGKEGTFFGENGYIWKKAAL